MGVENFDQQSYADAFDRNLEGMRITEVKEALGFMVEEVAGIPQEPSKVSKLRHYMDGMYG